MINRLLEEYTFVKKVVHSCSSEEQLNNAYSWAQDWAMRMKRNYPQDVPSWEDLYQSVIK